MESRVISCLGIEGIILRKDKRSRKVKITVRSRNDIRVSLPVHISFSTAEGFVKDKFEWINESLERMEAKSSSPIYFDETTEFKTRNHVLKIEKSLNSKSTVRIINSKIYVKYSRESDVTDGDVQILIKSSIEKALRKEAREYLPERTKILAKKFNFKYKKVFLKNAKTRWGSCSGENNINLNIHLMRFPDKYIDYVILHELAHTVEKNHSINFWKLLDSLVGDSKEIRKEMKSFSTTLL